MTNVTRKIFPARVSPLESAIICLITRAQTAIPGAMAGKSSHQKKPEGVALLSVMHDMGSAEIIFRFLITQLRIALCRLRERLLLARFPVPRRQKGGRPLVILSDYTVGVSIS